MEVSAFYCYGLFSFTHLRDFFQFYYVDWKVVVSFTNLLLIFKMNR